MPRNFVSASQESRSSFASSAGATADRVAVVTKAEADLEAVRERHGGRYELVARLWLQEWGWAERKPKGRSTCRG